MPDGIPGEIDVIVDGLDLTSKDTTDYMSVLDQVNRVRPAGIIVNIKPVTLITINFELFVNLSDALRTDEEMDDILEGIRSVIMDHFRSLKAGEHVIRNRLVAAALDHPEVYNVDDFVMGSRIFDEKLGGMVSDTRRRLDPRTSDLEIDMYERATIGDIKIITQFTPRVINYLILDLFASIQPTHKSVSSRKIKENIENAIDIHLERLKSGEEIDYARIENLLKNIEGVSIVQDMSFNSLHEETGLTQTECRENISLLENEIVKLGNVEIDILEDSAESDE